MCVCVWAVRHIRNIANNFVRKLFYIHLIFFFFTLLVHKILDQIHTFSFVLFVPLYLVSSHCECVRVFFLLFYWLLGSFYLQNIRGRFSRFILYLFSSKYNLPFFFLLARCFCDARFSCFLFLSFFRLFFFFFSSSITYLFPELLGNCLRFGIFFCLTKIS